MAAAIAFWQRKRLHEMTDAEWESLCDGCARCCLQKLQDEDDEQVYYTDIACRYLDDNACQCTVYGDRFNRVPDCMDVKQMDPDQYQWLPSTCAYRRLSEGRPLPAWHPLLTGDPGSVHSAGMSMQGRVVSEDDVPEDQWEERLIHWVQ